MIARLPVLIVLNIVIWTGVSFYFGMARGLAKNESIATHFDTERLISWVMMGKRIGSVAWPTGFLIMIVDALKLVRISPMILKGYWLVVLIFGVMILIGGLRMHVSARRYLLSKQPPPRTGTGATF